MNNKPIGTFLLTAALAIFFLQACNSGDENPTSPPTKSTVTKQDPDTLKDILTGYLSQTILINRDTNQLINKTLALINAFDSMSADFKRDSFEITEKTTEGGELVAIHSPSTQFIRIDGDLFGEMGKLEFRFYMINKDAPLFSCVIYKHIEYDKPIQEKDMKMGAPVITYEIYSDNHLVAVLNTLRIKMSISAEVMNEKERDTKQFVKDYLGQAHILK
jgi:hypothetical protein